MHALIANCALSSRHDKFNNQLSVCVNDLQSTVRRAVQFYTCSAKETSSLPPSSFVEDGVCRGVEMAGVL